MCAKIYLYQRYLFKMYATVINYVVFNPVEQTHFKNIFTFLRKYILALHVVSMAAISLSKLTNRMYSQ